MIGYPRKGGKTMRVVNRILPGYLTSEQVADILGVSVGRVRQLAEKLGGIKTPGLLYPERNVMSFAKLKRPAGWKPGRKRRPVKE